MCKSREDRSKPRWVATRRAHRYFAMTKMGRVSGFFWIPRKIPRYRAKITVLGTYRRKPEGYLGLQYCNTVQYNTIQYNTIHAVVKWLKNGHVTHIANTGDGTLRITSNPVAHAIHGTKVVPRATVLGSKQVHSRQAKKLFFCSKIDLVARKFLR